MSARQTTMTINSEAPGPDEVHATTEAAETSPPAPATTTQGTEAGVATPPAKATERTAPAPTPDREGALTRSRRSSAPSPWSQVEAIEQRRANLSREVRRSPFDAERPYRNTSLEHVDVDSNTGWQGPEVDRSRILRRRARTSNTFHFGANEVSDSDEDDEDEMSTEVWVTAETQWALETAGLIQVWSEYSDNDDDDH